MSGAASPALTVVVPVAPYVYVVERIAGDRVLPLLLVPPGRSPHTYAPTPQQIAALADAGLLFRADLALEEGVTERLTALNPSMRVVRLTREPEVRPRSGRGEAGYEQAMDEHEREHDDDHHDARGHDPHTWLDPRELARQAAVITDALAQADPAGAAIYAVGRDSLARDIARLDTELRERLAPFVGGRFYVHHPAFGHFAEAYGLEQVAIEHEGKEPSARRLAELIEQAEADGVRAVMVQPQHAGPAASTLAGEIGASVVIIDPLAYDLPATLRELTDAVVGSWEAGAE